MNSPTAQGAETASLAIGATLGVFVIEELLGSGSMGQVYRARHQRLGRQVALKVLREELAGDQSIVDRFLQEGRAVNQIDHEHIVEVHDYVEEQNPARVYCVMELLHGETLAQRMTHRPSTLESLRSMGRQLANALGASHAAGVVHRDLKPENIFLVSRAGRDDWVKVLDFGVAKCVQPLGQVSLVQTAQGAVLGTPRYMAPEQVAGLEVDARTDVYALGIILYELISGSAPFDDPSFGQLAARIITEAPAPLPAQTAGHEAVPADLAALISACLSKDPSDRPASMAAVEAALASPIQLLTRVQRRPSRALGLAALAPALVLMIGLWRWLAPAQPVELQPLPVPLPALAVAAPVAVVAQEVTLWVATQPAGALVSRLDSGQPLGRTPFEVKLARATASLPLRLELEGYQPLDREVSIDGNHRLELTLQALPRPKSTRRGAAIVTDGVIDPY